MPTQNLRDLERALEVTANKLESLSEQWLETDPIKFCIETLGFTPTEYQRKVLLDNNQLICLRWSRQSGKTTTIAAKLIWTAITKPASAIAVVSPSHRQSKEVLSRIARFARRLPKGRIESIQKTRISFANGSLIEAFPNNPSTIRGPTLNTVYCDEMGFIREDKELYAATLFTLAATNGTFIASSTPGSRDSIFYNICTDPTYKFSNHHVTWKDALEPHGPLKQNLLTTIRRQLESDPWRWSREMEAEFAENEESFFPLALITKAVDETLTYRDITTTTMTDRRLYAGLDFGKHRDYSVLAIVEYDSQTKMSTLMHLHRFPLETDYAAVIGYVKRLTDKWQTILKITTDTTGVGDVVTAEMRNMDLRQTWGITFTAQNKTDILENLHRMLAESRLKLVYDPELFAEMNAERYEMNKSGQLLFSHPSGTHDDRLWALALACHGLRHALASTGYQPVAALGHVIKRGPPRLRWSPPMPWGNWFFP